MYYPFARPFYVMLKPAGPRCNLSCRYCYYLDKQQWNTATGHPTMSDELLEKFIREYLAAHTSADVFFIWHGGEPLLRPIAFYQRAIELQQRYGQGLNIENCLQTNGTLLTDDWCRFLRDNRFLVGISVDGPQELHDHYRRSADGKPTFGRVMRGLELLKKHGVQWNAMATVNSYNADHPHEFYEFFRKSGCTHLQFAPVVEPSKSHDAEAFVTAESVTPRQWGRFLCQLFDEWAVHDVGLMAVQLFEDMLANWMGLTPGLCMLSHYCGHAGVMEANGDVYSCDHFVFPAFRLGNLNDQSLVSMMYSEHQQAFARKKQSALPRQCQECRFLPVCHGECPKNRLISDKYGQPGLNYLCEGYQHFFAHVAPFMDEMAQSLQNNKSPLPENGEDYDRKT